LAHFINDELNLEQKQDCKPILERRLRWRKKKIYAEMSGFEREYRVVEPCLYFRMIYGAVWGF
jgi:hypothetical protein